MSLKRISSLVYSGIGLLMYWSIPALPVFADTPFQSEIGGLSGGYQGKGTANAPDTLETIVSKTVGFLTVAGGATFLVYLLVGGLTWITSREESERISKAKQMLTNALVGLAIMVSAWAFAGVMGVVFGFDILDLATLLNTLKPSP